MDQKFSKTLDIKRCMETLLEIEEEYFTIRQRLKTSHKKTTANPQASNGGKRSRRPEHPASKKQKLDNTTQPSQLDNPPQSSVNDPVPSTSPSSSNDTVNQPLQFITNNYYIINYDRPQ